MSIIGSPVAAGCSPEFSAIHVSGDVQENDTIYATCGNLRRDGVVSREEEIVLPDEYQRVEYLQSSGEQICVIDYYPSSDSTFEIQLRFDDTHTASKDTPIFGCSENNYYCFSANFGGGAAEGYNIFNWYGKAYASGGVIKSFTIDSSTKTTKNTYKYSRSTNLVTYGDFSITPEMHSYTFTQSKFGLFGGVSDGTTYTPFGATNCYVYYAKFYHGDNLSCILVPCYRKSDNKPGMYDTVSSTFYTNQGTGTDFSVGSNIDITYVADITGIFKYDTWAVNCIRSGEAKHNSTVEINRPSTFNVIFSDLPSEYTRLNYIRSTGTQYIDTGIVPTVDTNTEMILMRVTHGSSQYDIPFGCRDNNSGHYAAYLLSHSGSGDNINGVYADFGADNKSTSATIYAETGEKYTWYLVTNNSNKVLYVNNTLCLIWDLSQFSGTCAYTLKIGGFNNNSSTVETRSSAYNFYSVKIYSTGTDLVRNLVPAKRNSDSVIGMYDTVSKTFFTNAGTGTFIGG